jgi:exodeoxyribonuclease-3
MKIVSWNVNGLRSVYQNGFLIWLKETNAEIVCLQEIKAQEGQLPQELLKPQGYDSYFSSARKKGYSGVTVYTKQKPFRVEKTTGLSRFDQEGRFLKLDYADFSLINIYLPHGGRRKENLTYKLQAYSTLINYLYKIRQQKIILIGDFNIAHQDLDLARPKQNQNNIMFTTQERQQIDTLINLGFIDSFRQFHHEGGHYTWFSYLHQAREQGLGWRIDYAFVSQKLKPLLAKASILSEVKGSDHCPIGIALEEP